MKLNDFIHKKPPVKKATTQFVLENAALEQKYQDQINSLDFELGQYRTMEIERDEAVRKSGVDKEKGMNLMIFLGVLWNILKRYRL